MGSVLVALNGAEVWAYAVGTDEGLRVRLDIDDWQRLNLTSGQRIAVRLPGQDAQWLFVASAAELPPVVWVVLAKRIRAAG
jgi:hypothetical protein